MRMIKTIAVASAGLLGALTSASAQETFITIGTGGQTGVYYVVGQSICSLVNRGQSQHGIRCTAPSTGGSIANINAIKAGDMDMGVAQSDWQYHAYNGSARFEGEGFPGIRAVFSVHPEPFTVVARADAGISTFDDLKGKRVNVGVPGSGQLATMQVVLDAKGWTMDDFSLASELAPSEQAQAMCDNKVDAIIFTAGHPNGSIQEATTSCEAVLVDVSGPAIEQLVADNPFYAVATVPGGMYAGNPEDVTTFGVRATFVSADTVPEETIYQTVKAVFDNFGRFKRLHPAFATLNEEEMITSGNSAPLHDGARRYFAEKGWLPTN
ncbi:TAXI family TRAP transporter solute-binding subunit [Rubrimonas cliftonensis]|uniref:TRAP transporter solute receptor, TAXI family n=1 Tax=Rubrimonas cliftonensis TaxID=89524 RepID=A0A1H3WX82_9RHOB|nr:TAXI family TRAP transporter solute-binding subunit [Rubrimonas cliftonensis]SDZ91580.1 hypothetical protein SAMN05444370_102167 [Rubrimonas cliftonensis]